jgi:hypothetical protein
MNALAQARAVDTMVLLAVFSDGTLLHTRRTPLLIQK